MTTRATQSGLRKLFFVPSQDFRTDARLIRRAARRTTLVSLAFALSLVVSSALPPPVAAGSTPRLLSNWDGWVDNSHPNYKFASSMPLAWMRSAVTSGINTSGNTIYQNPHWHLTTGTPNLTVGMRLSPSVCAGAVSAWYACTELVQAWSKWKIDFSSGYCWTNGSGQQDCFDELVFDVQSIALHEILHVNNLGHHFPVEPLNSVMDFDFPHQPEPHWQNRTMRGHDLSGLSTMYARDQCPPCPNFAGPSAYESNTQAVSEPPQPGRCVSGGGGDVAYGDIRQFAWLADAVAIAEVVDVGKLQYSTGDGESPSCDDAVRTVSVGRIIELREVVTLAGASRATGTTFRYWLVGGTLGGDSSRPHHFGLEVPDVGDQMLAFLGPAPFDLDSGPGVLDVHAFELMRVRPDGRIETPDPQEVVSKSTVDAAIRP